MIPTLNPGDKIAIVAPAKTIEEGCVLYAKQFLEEKGFTVVIGDHCLGTHHYFSGTSEERISDFQKAIDDPSVKAILCARGGYGCIQIVDDIDWSRLVNSPKWIIGFSDVTFFHSRLNLLGLKSIHGTMPLDFESNTSLALESLIAGITGVDCSITIPSSQENKLGSGKGTLVGGNLSILYSLLGTNDQLDYSNSILFIEDLAEYLYVIDRMSYAFKKAGIFDKINGLIVGGMTGIKDTAIPFGSTIEEILRAPFQNRDIPIAFDFPAGHIDDNRALILGAEVSLDVNSDSTVLSYL